MSVFPLPISNNFKLFNFRFASGSFTDWKILWPAQFVKSDSNIGPEHVFILKNGKNEYQHCLWRWNQREPELLTKEYWPACFDKSLHTSISDRYLFRAHSLQLLLPYVPHSLHREWQSSSIHQRDDTFVVSYFKKYFDLNVFEDNKKRFDRFPGWHKKVLRKSQNEYVKYMCQPKQILEVPINLGVKIEDLKPDKKLILDQACALLHTIFPNFCMEIQEQ